MAVAQTINDLLTQRAPDSLCDDCIAEALNLKRRQQSAQVTQALGTTSDFTRLINICSNCGDDKTVTQAKHSS